MESTLKNILSDLDIESVSISMLMKVRSIVSENEKKALTYIIGIYHLADSSADNVKKVKLANSYIDNFFNYYDQAFSEAIDIADAEEISESKVKALLSIFSFIHNIGNNICELLSVDRDFQLGRETHILNKYDAWLIKYVPYIFDLDNLFHEKNGHYYNEAVVKRVKMSRNDNLIKKYCRK